MSLIAAKNPKLPAQVGKDRTGKKIQFYSNVFFLAGYVFTEKYQTYVTYTECCSVNAQLDTPQCKYFLSHDAGTLLPGLELACRNVGVSVQLKHCSVKITNESNGCTWRR